MFIRMRHSWGAFVLISSVLGLTTSAWTVGSEPVKIALVIGNSRYTEGLVPLANPGNDALDMKTSLESLGFRVESIVDGNRRTFRLALDRFRNYLKGNPGATAVFFFAGHGVQQQKENWLLPVGEVFETPEDVAASAFSVSTIVEAIDEGQALRSLIILDACREDPFAKGKTRSISQTRGLSAGTARPSSEGGSVILYATGPGDVAQDGQGQNGVFTAEILQAIRQGLSVRDMIDTIRRGVMEKTGGRQKPYAESSADLASFYLSAPSAVSAGPTQAAGLLGKAHFESTFDGAVYWQGEYLGDVGPGKTFDAEGLAVGKQEFSLQIGGSTRETISTTLTAKNRPTVSFGQVPQSPVTVVPTVVAPTTPQVLVVDRSTLLASRDQRVREAGLVPPVNLGSWIGTGAGVLATLTGYGLVQALKPSYLAATTVTDVNSFHGWLSATNQLYKFGVVTTVTSLSIALVTQMLMPNTSDLDQQISVLNASMGLRSTQDK